MQLNPIGVAIIALAAATGAMAASTDQPAQLSLTLQNHRFTPAALVAPAGRKIHIVLTNLDNAAEEFDSSDLHVEEDVTPKSHTDFTVGPLRPGVYHFIGEAHAATAQGRITVTGGGQ